jgi:hypothetical protein
VFQRTTGLSQPSLQLVRVQHQGLGGPSKTGKGTPKSVRKPRALGVAGSSTACKRMHEVGWQGGGGKRTITPAWSWSRTWRWPCMGLAEAPPGRPYGAWMTWSHRGHTRCRHKVKNTQTVVAVSNHVDPLLSLHAIRMRSRPPALTPHSRCGTGRRCAVGAAAGR